MSRTLVTPATKGNPSPAVPVKKKETNRDLIEQIVVAFILAFLIRGFAVEAFVIPTGSMAPTLYGQHKEVTCPQCGEVFAVNAASESDDDRRIPQFVGSATCLNCRYQVTNLEETPSFKGDRILVMKFLYNLPKWLGGIPPNRWDVVVFHYPEEPETNYIKRLIGLPGEMIRIYFGDVLSRPLNSSEPFTIQRKSIPQQLATQQLVWDDAHRPRSFENRPEWRRWSTVDGEGAKRPSWNESEKGTYRADASAEWTPLSYRNLVPTSEQWQAALADVTIPGSPKPSLISDFYAYNSATTTDYLRNESWFQPHWVGDLTVSGVFEAEAQPAGNLRLELIEGGIPHRCEIDLATGQATLSRGGTKLAEPVETSLLADGKPHDFAFANVDDRLTLWIDGKLPFGDGVIYETAETHVVPTPEDLLPVTIAVKGVTAKVTGLVLKRDLYYTQNPSNSDYADIDLRQGSPSDHRFGGVAESLEILSDPAMFEALGSLKWTDYPIRDGHYMMMGDNSPMSKDGRAWQRQDSMGYYDKIRRIQVSKWAETQDRQPWEVPEAYLIGKAFFVFWPHGVPLWPNLKVPMPPRFQPSRDIRFPFRPYVERMKWIR